MADEEKIVLNLEIQARGATGVTTEIKKIEGTFADLEAELKRIAGLEGGFGPQTKQQIAALRRNLSELNTEYKAVGKSISEITAKGIGTNSPRIRVATSGTGAGLSSSRQREAELRRQFDQEIEGHKRLQREINRIIKQGDAEKRAAKREERAEERRQAKEDLEFQRSLQRDLNRIKQEAVNKEREINRAHRDALKEDREFNKNKVNEINRQISNQSARANRSLQGSGEERFFAAAAAKQNKPQGGSGLANALRPAIASAGFVGLNIAQQLGTIFDPIKAKGLIAPQITRLGQLIGGLFGQTFGSIFGDLGDVAGRAFEIVFDTIGAVARGGIKIISGVLSGLSTAIIGLGSTLLLGLNPASILGSVFTLTIGVVGGLISGIVSAFGSLVKDLTSIIGNLFGVIGSLLSAGFTALKAIFDAGLNILKGLWTAFWEGLKAIVEFSFEGIKSIIGFGVGQIVEGFKDFVLAEKLATKSFVNIAGEAENSGKSFAKGTEEVRRLGNQLRIAFGADVTDAQSAIFDILSGGFSKIEDANKIISSSGKLAVIGQDSLKDSTKAVTSTLLAYGKSADEAEHVGAVISSTAKAGRFDLSEFNNSLGTVINQAAVANVPFEELGAAIATISLSGINAKASAVGLNRLLLAMTNPTKQNAKAFNDLGIEFTTIDEKGRRVVKPFRELFQEFAKADPTKLRELFGTTQGIRAFNALNQNASKFKGILDNNSKAAEQFDKDFKNSKGTFDFIFRSLTQIGSVIRENIGRGFLEVVRGPLQAMGPVLERLVKILDGKNVRRFFTEFQNFAKPILDAVINPIISGLDKLVSYIETTDLSKMFKTGGAKELQSALIGIVNSVFSLPLAISDFYGILKGIGGVASFLFNEIIVPALKFLGSPSTYTGFLNGLQSAVGIAKILAEVINNSLIDPETMIANVNIVLGAIGNSFLIIGKFLTSVLVKAFEVTAGFFEATIIPRLVEALSSLLQSTIKGLSGFFGDQSAEAKKRLDTGGNGRASDIIDAQLMTTFKTLENSFNGFADKVSPRAKGDAFEVEPSFLELNKILKEGFVDSDQKNTFRSVVTGSIAENTNLPINKVEAILDIIKNSGSLKEAEGTARDAGLGYHVGQVLNSFLEEISNPRELASIRRRGEPELADRLENAAKEARIGGGQSRGKESFENSLQTVVPEMSTSLKELNDSLKDVAKNTFDKLKEANSTVSFGLTPPVNLTPTLTTEEGAVLPPSPGGLSPSSLNPKKKDLLFQSIPVPSDFVPTPDPYEKDKRTEKMEENSKTMVSLLRDVVDKLSTIADNSSNAGIVVNGSSANSIINMPDQGEFA